MIIVYLWDKRLYLMKGLLQTGYMEHQHSTNLCVCVRMCVCVFGNWDSLESSSVSASTMPNAASITGLGSAKPSLSKLENEKAETEKFQDSHL